MGLSKQEIKSIVKDTIQELLADSEFMEVLVKKIGDKVDNLEKVLNKQSEQVVLIEKRFEDTASRLNKKINDIDEKMSVRDQEIVKLENRIEQIQQSAKLRNVCIYGLAVDNSVNLLQCVKNVINNSVKIPVQDTDIISCYRVGKNASRPQPVIVKF